MTPQEALNLLANIQKEFKGKEQEQKLVAAANTIALEAAKWALQSLSRDKKLFDEIQAIKQALNPVDPTMPVEEAPASAPTASAPVDTGPRIGMDGKPMTPEEAAREAAMDAAIAGMSPADNVAPPPAKGNRWADPKAAPPPRAAAAPPPPAANGQAPTPPKA